MCVAFHVSETCSLTQPLKQLLCVSQLENYFYCVLRLHSVTLPSSRLQLCTSFYFSEGKGLTIFVMPESDDSIKASVQCIREIACYPVAEIIKLKLSC